MYKVIDPAGFNFDVPVFSEVRVHSRGIDSSWLSKSAAVLTSEMKAIRPEKDTTFVHVIALGDMEKIGANRNGDAFPTKANEKYHDTFVKHANFYREHKNKPKLGHKIYGFVKSSAHNKEMGRVELIVGIDHKKAPDTIQKIASGKPISVSMACNVPYDTCSICGNKSHNASEYCNCITKHAGSILEDGRQVAMINDHPKFFDISEVGVPADRTAYVLRKVASAEQLVLSVEKAAMYGMTDGPVDLGDVVRRRRFLQKLAAIEKEIEADLTRMPGVDSIIEALNDPMLEGDCPMSSSGMGGVFNALADARVSLPLRDFIKLVAGPRAAELPEHVISGAETMVPDAFRQLREGPASDLNEISNYEPLDIPVPEPVKRILSKVLRVGSLDGSPLQGKVTIISLNKRANKRVEKKAAVGQAGNLALEYAKYKVALLEKIANPAIIRLALMQNYK